MPIFDFRIVNMHNDSIGSRFAVKGQAVRFLLDIAIQPFADHALTVKFLTPVNESGVMEICDVNVIRVGQNLPCHSRDMFSAVYEER